MEVLHDYSRHTNLSLKPTMPNSLWFGRDLTFYLCYTEQLVQRNDSEGRSECVVGRISKDLMA